MKGDKDLTKVGLNMPKIGPKSNPTKIRISISGKPVFL